LEAVKARKYVSHVYFEVLLVVKYVVLIKKKLV